MNKKHLGLLVALLLFVGVGVYTYARYQTELNGEGTADVAKWAVVVKQNGSAVSEDFDLAFTVLDNAYVADGKVAPGSEATAQLVLDLTGTEVAVDYSVKLDTANVPEGMSFSSVKATVGSTVTTLTADANGVYSGELTLAQVASDKLVTVDFVVTWENDDAKNAEHTAIGEADAAIVIPVEVTVKQHINTTP